MFPRKNLGQKIDALYEKRAERIERQREVDEEIAGMKRDEAALRDEIIAEMERSGQQKSTGTDATASIQTNLIPRATDWDAIYKYIKKNDAFDLLERRIGRKAFKDRTEQGEHVPGIDVFEEKDLSLTKATR